MTTQAKQIKNMAFSILPLLICLKTISIIVIDNKKQLLMNLGRMNLSDFIF